MTIRMNIDNLNAYVNGATKQETRTTVTYFEENGKQIVALHIL